MSDKLVNIKNLSDLAKKLDKRNNDNIAIISEKINEIEENLNNTFSGDYNDLTNKPCYETSEIKLFTNDGDNTGRLIVNKGTTNVKFAKISEDEIDSNSIDQARFSMAVGDEAYEISDPSTFIIVENETGSAINLGEYVICTFNDNFAMDMSGTIVTFPEKGLYFSFNANSGHEWRLDNVYLPVTSIKQLDEKFIPDTIATKKYVDDEFDIQNFLIPDDFEGTDGEKLQACFDALKDTGGFISINREYVLDRDIVINQDSNLNLQTTIKGIGEVAKINCGPYCFKGKEGVKHSWGGIKFSDLQITGTETMMQCANLIRVICSSCLISDFKYVCYSPDYTQSMYFNECIIRNISESVMFAGSTESIDSGSLLDTRICLCLIEWCNHLLTAMAYSGCIVDNNCIEGFTGIPFTFNGRTRGVVIKNNYFEANAGGAIDLSGLSNVYSQNIIIDSNVFVTSDNAEVTILLPTNRVIGSCTISNNTASSYSTPLYIVPDSAKNYTGVYIYNNYGNVSGKTSIIDSNITKLNYANSINNVIKGSVVDINDGAEARKLTNVRYFGKTTQDGIPSVNSPSVPVSLLYNQNIKTYITTTKNILEITAATTTVNGITFEVASGQIRLSGITTADDVIFDLNYEQGKLNIPVGTWRMSGPASTYMYIQLYVDGQLVGQTRSTETLVTVPEGATESYVRLKVNGNTGTNLNGSIVSPMLVSVDDKDSSPEFEKFIKESFSTNFSNRSHGLHGVPVTAGGNYIDSTGQQWFADCVDFAKGTIDRRFKEITLDGTETWVVQTYSNQPAGMYCYRLALTNKAVGEGLSRCSHFQNVNKCWEFKQGCFTFSDNSSNRYSYFITDIATIEEWKSWLASNNVKFVYAISNVESEPLSENNLSQFSVIAVTKSHCRITNDKDCEMEVTYVVDTKSYIESTLDEKADKDHGTHLTLGTGSENAFRGDYGNTAYTHSQAAHAPSDAQKNSDITQEEIESKLTGRIYTHNHSRMTFDDNTHDGLTQPIDYDRGVFFNFSRQQENRFNGLEYSAVQTIKPFKAGDAGHQFVYPYNDDTVRNKIFYRSKLLKDSGWGEWAEIYTSLNKPTASDIGAATEEYVDEKIAEIRDEMVILEEDDLSMEGIIDNTFPNLTTTDKTLIGAINELNNKLEKAPSGGDVPSEGIETEIEKAVIDEMLMDIFGITVEEGE